MSTNCKFDGLKHSPVRVGADALVCPASEARRLSLPPERLFFATSAVKRFDVVGERARHNPKLLELCG
jgi:hypothetical protein